LSPKMRWRGVRAKLWLNRPLAVQGVVYGYRL
jgi:hypothetical protein